MTWGGQPWVLDLAGERPGLRLVDQPGGRFLALGGLGAPGASDLQGLAEKSLVAVEMYRSRLEATFAPAGWGELKVRASWSPSAGDAGIDLEVQASASSVDDLKAVEVYIVTEPTQCASSWSETCSNRVLPRDRRSAALSYDGREPADMLRRLATCPIHGAEGWSDVPITIPFSLSESAGHYLEMVHPDDVARRIRVIGRGQDSRSAMSAATRHGLFGHDLEKGVIVRARLRGLWMSAQQSESSAREAFREFLELPPPLGP